MNHGPSLGYGGHDTRVVQRETHADRWEGLCRRAARSATDGNFCFLSRCQVYFIKPGRHIDQCSSVQIRGIIDTYPGVPGRSRHGIIMVVQLRFRGDVGLPSNGSNSDGGTEYEKL